MSVDRSHPLVTAQDAAQLMAELSNWHPRALKIMDLLLYSYSRFVSGRGHQSCFSSTPEKKNKIEVHISNIAM
jgi:hypothetical protein